jgi:hypothetical protein
MLYTLLRTETMKRAKRLTAASRNKSDGATPKISVAPAMPHAIFTLLPQLDHDLW